jgi:hypothetical protein
MTAETPPAAVAPPTPDGGSGRPVDDPRAAQILATEHWSLLAGRSLAYNEAFTRAGMFLTFLSATLIVVGFLVASDRFADAVIPVVILLLAVNLYIGLATLGRIWDAGLEELATVRGMNRIRHAYAEMIPGIQRYFITSIHDDRMGTITSAYSRGGPTRPPSPLRGLLHGLTTTGGMVMSINGVLFAAITSVTALGLGATVELALGLAVVALLVGLGAFFAWGSRMWTRNALGDDPMFPSPPGS